MHHRVGFGRAGRRMAGLLVFVAVAAAVSGPAAAGGSRRSLSRKKGAAAEATRMVGERRFGTLRCSIIGRLGGGRGVPCSPEAPRQRPPEQLMVCASARRRKPRRRLPPTLVSLDTRPPPLSVPACASNKYPQLSTMSCCSPSLSTQGAP